MPQCPPADPSSARSDAARALTSALVELDRALTSLQAAAAWVLDSYGDAVDAETVRMLRLPGGPDRPGRPPVPPSPPAISQRAAEFIADLADIDRILRQGPDSVTADETGEDDR